MRQRLQGLRRRFAQAMKQHRPEVLYTYSFPLRTSDSERMRPGYTLVEATADTLAQLKKDSRGGLTDRKHQILLDRVGSEDERCWVISNARGRLCGYCHLAFTDTVNERIQHDLKVGPTQAYFFDDYVFKKHRGKGQHAFSIAARIDIAAGRGLTEGLTTITRKNAASIASYSKFGIRRQETLVHLPTLGRTFTLGKRKGPRDAG